MLIGLHHVGRVVHDLEHAARQLHAVSGWPITSFSAGDDPLVAGRDVHASRLGRRPQRVDRTGRCRSSARPATGGQRARGDPRRHPDRQHRTGHRTSLAGRHRLRHADPVGSRNRFPVRCTSATPNRLVTEIEGAPHAPADLEPWLVHGAIATPDAERLRSAYEDLDGSPAQNTAQPAGHPASRSVVGAARRRSHRHLGAARQRQGRDLAVPPSADHRRRVARLRDARIGPSRLRERRSPRRPRPGDSGRFHSSRTNPPAPTGSRSPDCATPTATGSN